MVPPLIWTLCEILEYANRFGLSLKLDQGKPTLTVPCPLIDSRTGNLARKARVVAEFIPHLTARREEIIAYFESTCAPAPEPIPKLPSEDTDKDIRERREYIIAQVRERARFSGRKVWTFGLRYSKKRRSSKLKQTDRGIKEVADYVNHICVEGDNKWTPLPQLHTITEPAKNPSSTSKTV